MQLWIGKVNLRPKYSNIFSLCLADFVFSSQKIKKSPYRAKTFFYRFVWVFKKSRNLFWFRSEGIFQEVAPAKECIKHFFLGAFWKIDFRNHLFSVHFLKKSFRSEISIKFWSVDTHIDLLREEEKIVALRMDSCNCLPRKYEYKGRNIVFSFLASGPQSLFKVYEQSAIFKIIAPCWSVCLRNVRAPARNLPT